MSRQGTKLLHALAVVMLVVGFNACGGWRNPSAAGGPPVPAATTLASEAEATESAIRFLEDRVKRDPDDFIALNKLASYYLARQRETGSLNYLDLAARAARASLAAMPAEMNKGGLVALAQAEFAMHEFAAARDHALQLSRLDPGKSYPFQILGDALIELGEYEKGAGAFDRMERIGGGSVQAETRLARYALLGGQTDVARRRLATALTLALDLSPPPRETVAWCRLQLGEVAFSIGDYEAAERHFRDALVTFPDYYRALAALGRVRAARGDLSDAIEWYGRAINVVPDPSYVAALGDLYKLAGRDSQAAAQYALVEQIGKLSAATGAVYNRQLALFYADHDMKSEEAYASAAKEYGVRRDIYGADTLAWAALKAGKLEEAQAAIRDALRLGTRDAKLYYHAGMIALASGDRPAAADHLNRALSLNPQFDPLQALNARKALAVATGDE
jgi:tetratricopeptide (TPR) repeat protein